MLGAKASSSVKSSQRSYQLLTILNSSRFSYIFVLEASLRNVMATPFYCATAVPENAWHISYQPSSMVQRGTSGGIPHIDQDILSLAKTGMPSKSVGAGAQFSFQKGLRLRLVPVYEFAMDIAIVAGQRYSPAHVQGGFHPMWARLPLKRDFQAPLEMGGILPT